MCWKFWIGSVVVTTLVVISVLQAQDNRNVSQKQSVDSIWQRLDQSWPKRNTGNHWTAGTLVHLQTELIQQELNLSEHQKRSIKRMRASFDAVVKKMCDDYYNQPLNLPQDEQIIQPSATTIYNAATPLRPNIEALLTPAQLRRLDQISFQTFGLRLFDSPGFFKFLGASDKQKKKAERLLKEFDQATKLLFELTFEGGGTLTAKEQDALDISYEKKLQATEKKTMRKILKIFTRQQRKQLKALWGKKIDIQKYIEQRQKAAIKVQYETPPGIKPHESTSITIQ